jgi:AraC-like DNA-binding protein/quercetin dioxygenase-like cupin family protein
MGKIGKLELLKNYLSNAQVALYTVNHTKVGPSWNDHNMAPEINRLYFIREGEGLIKVRNREYSPKPGQLFLLPAGVEHWFSTVSDNTFRKYWCHFTVKVGEIHLFQLIHVPHFIEIRDHDWLEERFRELIRLHVSPEFTAPLRIKSVMYDIVSLFLEQAARQLGGDELQMSAPPNVTKINAILDYIDRHLGEQMTIEGLARQVHFHPNYFLHVFKSMLGVSPILYINKKRIENARQLLITSDLTVSDIAGLTGMELYYFSRTFKKLTGLSPSEYRRNGESGRK